MVAPFMAKCADQLIAKPKPLLKNEQLLQTEQLY